MNKMAVWLTIISLFISSSFGFVAISSYHSQRPHCFASPICGPFPSSSSGSAFAVTTSLMQRPRTPISLLRLSAKKKGSNTKQKKKQQQKATAPPVSVVNVVKADDGNALQKLFSNECDVDGLMTKASLKAIPFIGKLVDEEELLDEELDEFWDAAPKFPDVNAAWSEDRIDVDSFMQIYRDIDDLFEEGEDDIEITNEKMKGKKAVSNGASADINKEVVIPKAKESLTKPATGAMNGTQQPKVSAAADPVSAIDEDDDDTDEKELEDAFTTICDTSSMLLSNSNLRNWKEIMTVIDEDQMLSESEFDMLWDQTAKSPGSPDMLDLDGFLSFNVALDDLFVFEDEEIDSDYDDDEEEEPQVESVTMVSMEDISPGVLFSKIADTDNFVGRKELKRWTELQEMLDEEELLSSEFNSFFERASKSPTVPDKLTEDGFIELYNAIDALFEDIDDDGGDTSSAHLPMVSGEDVPPGVLFSQIANVDYGYTVGREELKRWVELQEMLNDGDVLTSELESMFNAATKSPTVPDKLTEDGFIELYEAIDALFEDDEDEADDNEAESSNVQGDNDRPSDATIKNGLLDYIAKIQGPEDLPCGLDADEAAQTRILNVASALETTLTNKVNDSTMSIIPQDLAGDWDLIYTSSGMMKFNKGLTGLGGSFPNGQFGGLVQTFVATKYIMDVDYKERILVNPDIQSFDATVNGDWNLKSSVSLLSGSPTILIAVEPDMVKYGPTATRADHWKSVRCMNVLDLAYLDDDLRIMRGNMNPDTLFIFKKI